MDSPQINESANYLCGALIDWSTPEIVNNKTRQGDYSINNPFDKIELEAANMSPFDLIPDQITLRKEPPCENMLSPLGESEYRKIQSSMLLTDIDHIANNSEQNYKEQVKDGTVVRGQSKDIMENDKGNNISIVENKLIENHETKTEDVSISDHNTVDIEQISLCTEEEKEQIREETRRRIEVLIEKAKKEYKENYSRKSLLCTTLKSSDSSLNETKNDFNKGFIQDKFSSNSNGLNNTSSGKTYDNTIDVNESSPFPYHELNSMDLDSLNPDWVVDSFMDSDSSTEVQIKNKSITVVGSGSNSQVDMSTAVEASNSQVDIMSEAVSGTESVESKQTACPTVVTMKSTQNKRILNKGPFLANIPIEHMVQNYHDMETKKINHAPNNSPRDKLRPVATSTPTIDISTIFKTPFSDSPIKSKNFLRRSIPNSNSNTPLNVTKRIQRSSSNNEIVLSEININKSKLASKITNTQKPVVLKNNKLSGLPVLKKFTSFNGKENVKPQ